MSLSTKSINIPVSNQSSNKGSVLTKLFTPIALGTAVAFCGQVASAQDVQPEVPVQDTQSEPTQTPNPENNKDQDSSKFIFGYIAGAVMGHLLENLSQRRKRQGLEETIEQLRGRIGGQQVIKITANKLDSKKDSG